MCTPIAMAMLESWEAFKSAYWHSCSVSELMLQAGKRDSHKNRRKPSDSFKVDTSGLWNSFSLLDNCWDSVPFNPPGKPDHLTWNDLNHSLGLLLPHTNCCAVAFTAPQHLT